MVSITEVNVWASRLCCDASAAGTAGPPICWDPYDGGAIRVISSHEQQGEAAPELNGSAAAPSPAALLGPGWRLVTREELAALSVRELKARLQRAGINCGGCTEKRELVELLLELPSKLWTDLGQQAQPGRCPSVNPNGSPVSSHSMGSGSSGGQQGNVASRLQSGQPQQAQHHGVRHDLNGAGRGKLAPAPKRCACCGATAGPGTKLKVCSGCRSVHFCGEACQRRAWPGHKAACRASQQKG